MCSSHNKHDKQMILYLVILCSLVTSLKQYVKIKSIKLHDILLQLTYCNIDKAKIKYMSVSGKVLKK